VAKSSYSDSEKWVYLLCPSWTIPTLAVSALLSRAGRLGKTEACVLTFGPGRFYIGQMCG